MKCAECGHENKEGTRFCGRCGARMAKQSVISDTGSALRKIYNDFGYEKVFEDSRYITSALNDMIPDAEMVCSSIEHAYRAGLGKLYESQVKSGIRPDASFYLRVNKLITDDAGFSEKKAKQLIQIFDEMLGWDTQVIPNNVTAPKPVITKTNVASVNRVAPVKPAPKPAGQVGSFGTIQNAAAVPPKNLTKPYSQAAHAYIKTATKPRRNIWKVIIPVIIVVSVIFVASIAVILTDAFVHITSNVEQTTIAGPISSSQAYSGIENYVRSNESEENRTLRIDSSTDEVLVVYYHPVGGDAYKFHIDLNTGDTYVTKRDPIGGYDLRTGVTFNVKNYIK